MMKWNCLRLFNMKILKLYLLVRVDEADYDENESLVVRAYNRKSAREIANVVSASEGKIWGNSRLTQCFRLKDDGKDEGVIIIDNRGS